MTSWVDFVLFVMRDGRLLLCGRLCGRLYGRIWVALVSGDEDIADGNKEKSQLSSRYPYPFIVVPASRTDHQDSRRRISASWLDRLLRWRWSRRWEARSWLLSERTRFIRGFVFMASEKGQGGVPVTWWMISQKEVLIFALARFLRLSYSLGYALKARPVMAACRGGHFAMMAALAGGLLRCYGSWPFPSPRSLRCSGSWFPS